MPVHPEDIERVLMPGRLRSIGRAGNINNNIIISSAEYQANQRVLHFLLRGFPPASSPIPDLPPVIIAVRPANAIPSPLFRLHDLCLSSQWKTPPPVPYDSVQYRLFKHSCFFSSGTYSIPAVATSISKNFSFFYKNSLKKSQNMV